MTAAISGPFEAKFSSFFWLQIVLFSSRKKKRNFLLLKLLFDLKCECYCHLKCPVKPKISTMALAVVNQNIYIFYMFILYCFCSQTCTDAGRFCAVKMLQGLKGANIVI